MVDQLFKFFGFLAGLPTWGRVVAWAVMVVMVFALLRAAAGLLRRIGPVLRPTLAPLGLILAGAGALLLTDQGIEIAESLADDGWLLPALFVLSVSFWAWQSWFWARAALYLRFDVHRGSWFNPGWMTWLPRGYGLAVFAIGLVLVWRALPTADGKTSWFWAISAALAAAAALFLAAVIAREPMWQRARVGALAPGRPLGRLVQGLARLPAPTAWRSIAHHYPLANLNILLTVAVLLILVFWAGWYPVEVGRRFGSAALGFVALGTWVSVLTALQLMQPRRSVSLILLLVAVSLAGSWLRHYHRVRVVEGTYTSVPLRFEDAARRWAENVHAGKNMTAVPIVFVATAGGGLRAAYWTAEILTTLNRDYPRFYDHLFAISSVSGGSLGAVVAQAAVGAERAGLLNATDARQAALDGLAHDYLAPVIAAGVYTDIVGSVLPDAFGFGGRGTALENAWSAGVPVAGSYPLDRPFLDLWRPVRDHGWLPVLLLNATHEETGKRVITSNLRIDNWPFADAMDLRAALGRDPRASTAVHNSARFSWVSPPGTILDTSNQQHGHVLDGGYFENYGALTLLEAIEGLRKVLDGVPLRPVIIQISSDPALLSTDIAGPADRICPPPHPKPLPWAPGSVSPWAIANEALAPVGGLYQTREARGVNASKLVARWAPCVAADDADLKGGPGTEPEYVHLAMCDRDRPAPLGWLMAAHTRADLDRLLDPAGCNALELTRLYEALAPLASEPLPSSSLQTTSTD